MRGGDEGCLEDTQDDDKSNWIAFKSKEMQKIEGEEKRLGSKTLALMYSSTP